MALSGLGRIALGALIRLARMASPAASTAGGTIALMTP
jgi:hypothetical protein